jgi:hypothetical protein
MDITFRKILSVVVPAIVTVVASAADGAWEWRVAVKEYQQARQLAIVDTILSIPDSKKRVVVAEFYLSSGALTGEFKAQMEKAINGKAVEGDILSQ